jgi:hypothetical protein
MWWHLEKKVLYKCLYDFTDYFLFILQVDVSAFTNVVKTISIGRLKTYSFYTNVEENETTNSFKWQSPGHYPYLILVVVQNKVHLKQHSLNFSVDWFSDCMILNGVETNNSISQYANYIKE